MADMCECICSHINAMVRLLHMLRTSSTNCSGNECIPDLNAPENSSNIQTLQIIAFWIVFGYMMFRFRPDSLRSSNRNSQRENDPLLGKPSSSSNNSNSNPPPPPPPALD
eukprot:Nk52_evm2s276 gene=Nk52_evmTU2s276